MLINLTELLTKDGKEKDYTLHLGMETFQAPDGVYDLVEAEPVRLHVLNAGGRMLVVGGSAQFALMIPCSRCLEPVRVPFSLTLERALDMNQTDEDRVQALDEQPYLQGYNLDVDQLVRDELLLNLPMKVLCNEDCKGICNRCGANLNYETCGCDCSVPDPRMSVIQDIFKQFKEV